MASPTDDGFHEIQLNGKQLVFLFMAATVVSVVIFLCGVLVGRGVRTERTAAQTASFSEAPSPEILPSAPQTAPQAIQSSDDPRMAAPPSPIDEKSTAITEDIKPDSVKAAEARAAEKAAAAVAAAAPVPAVTPTPSEKQKTASAKTDRAQKAGKAAEKPIPIPTQKPMPESAAPAAVTPPATQASATPPTPASSTSVDGYAVQVAAVNGRTDADAIAKRFSSKGYSAYVEQPPSGAGTVFRVRIGTFKTKREAETIAAKLQKEEQIKPWVTR